MDGLVREESELLQFCSDLEKRPIRVILLESTQLL